jgi:Ca2+-binding EF-hand superfamily protein
MAFYGVSRDVMVRELNLKFKLAIQQRGGLGIRTLGLIFKRMDFNGNKKLDASEFEQALAAFGLFPKKVEVQALMAYYDVDQDGNITYEEFLRGLRDELTERRRVMVGKAFQMLDKDGSGQITISDISGIYDVSMNPEFLEGRKTRDEILTDFMSNFEGAKGDGNGIITMQEFVDYYTDLSMSTPSDEYFVRMMESTWQVPENEDSAVTQQTVAHLLREVKSRVFELARQNPQFLQKIFNDFDLNQSGHLTIDEVTNLIAKLKISVERKFVYPFFKVVDQNNSGGIEYDEFEAFILGKQ